MSITPRNYPTSPAKARSVLASLVYEEIDGNPYYYRGYRAVMARQKTKEDIMGASSLIF